VSLSELGDLLKSRWELGQLAASAKSLDCSELVVRGAARPDQVRVVGVRQAICPWARGRHDGALFEEQDGAAGAGKRECVGDRLDSLRVGDGVASAVEDAKAHSFLIGDAREEFGAVDLGAADLEMRRAGPAERTAAEQRSTEIRSAAARAHYDPPWRVPERREAGAEHAGLVEHLERVIVSGDV
jgi:hypothetical protein